MTAASVLLLVILPAGDTAKSIPLPCGDSEHAPLHLWSQPDPRAAQNALVECGGEVAILEDEEQHPRWMKIRAPNGVEGFLPSALVRPPETKVIQQASRKGGDRKPPVLLFRVEPEYTEQARMAKHEGTSVLYGVIDENGIVQNLAVVRSLGMGLDESAMKAVRRWVFRPSMKDGHPVKTPGQFEVTFRLINCPRPVAGARAGPPAGICADADPAPSYVTLRPMADRANQNAQYALGCAYYWGKSIPQDYEWAHMWFTLAASRGVREAATARTLLSRQMTPMQIAVARHLAKDWKAKAH